MRKYSMLILTILLALLTVGVYAYENYNTQLPNIKQPHLDITSNKYGKINNIVWVDNYISHDTALLILANKENNDLNYSYLYYLNVETGQDKLLAEFPAHKYLNDVILFDNPFSSNSIVTAYNKGLVKTTLIADKGQELQASSEKLEIPGFTEATSMDFKGDLFFTKSDTELIHHKKFFKHSFFIFSNNESLPELTTYYRKPYSIINANGLDRLLTYTSVDKNKVNLYAMYYDGTLVTKFNKPLITDIISAKAIEDSYGFIGMSVVEEQNSTSDNKSLNIFMIRGNLDDDQVYYHLDNIPYNKDRFGAIPDLDSTTYNEDYSLVYTCFDENHQGQIRIRSYLNKPKVIIDKQNIFGPIRISNKKFNEKKTKVILYFTYEGDTVQAKICDLEGNLIKNITDMLI